MKGDHHVQMPVSRSSFSTRSLEIAGPKLATPSPPYWGPPRARLCRRPQPRRYQDTRRCAEDHSQLSACSASWFFLSLFVHAPSRADLAYLASLIDAKKLEVVVDRVFPFAEARQALAYLATGPAEGKRSS